MGTYREKAVEFDWPRQWYISIMDDGILEEIEQCDVTIEDNFSLARDDMDRILIDRLLVLD